MKKGFILIEVLISVIILSIAFVSLMHGIRHAVKINKRIQKMFFVQLEGDLFFLDQLYKSQFDELNYGGTIIYDSEYDFNVQRFSNELPSVSVGEEEVSGEVEQDTAITYENHEIVLSYEDQRLLKFPLILKKKTI